MFYYNYTINNTKYLNNNNNCTGRLLKFLELHEILMGYLRTN